MTNSIGMTLGIEKTETLRIVGPTMTNDRYMILAEQTL
jgi:hypothetical protein